MTVEPMTDAELDPPMTDDELDAIERHMTRAAGAGHVAMITAGDLDRIRVRIRLAEAERDTAAIDLANRRADTLGDRVVELIREVADARSALKRAEAERDAAVARAMPEARLIRTKAEAAQLPAGTYYVSPPEAGEGWFAVEALDTVSGPRWLYLDEGDPRGDHMIAGCLVIRLPDLPTPTAGETP